MAAKYKQHNLPSQFEPKRNVAIFSLAYAPFFGGAEVALKEITTRLKDGYNFYCFTHKFDKAWKSEEEIDGVKVVRVGRGGKPGSYYGQWFGKRFYSIRAFWAAEKSHKKNNFSFVWVMMASYPWLGALLFKLRHPDVPLLLTLQEGDAEGHILKQVGIFYPLWKMLFKKADYIQVISSYLGDFARRHGARCPIEVVPNGVNVVEEGMERRERKSDERKWPLVKSEKIIITTSRLVHKNGIDTLIRSVAELKKQRDDFTVQILGAGPLDEDLEDQALKIGVRDKVEFLGSVPPEDIPQYLRRAFVFVRPSRSEGLGSSFLEAMAEGVPIIGTNVGGIPDFLKDPNRVGVAKATGLFSKVDDPNDLAKKILLLINNDELRKSLIKNGRALIAKNYYWDKIAVKMGVIFSKIIET